MLIPKKSFVVNSRDSFRWIIFIELLRGVGVGVGLGQVLGGGGGGQGPMSASGCWKKNLDRP